MEPFILMATPLPVERVRITARFSRSQATDCSQIYIHFLAPMTERTLMAVCCWPATAHFMESPSTAANRALAQWITSNYSLLPPTTILPTEANSWALARDITSEPHLNRKSQPRAEDKPASTILFGGPGL